LRRRLLRSPATIGFAVVPVFVAVGLLPIVILGPSTFLVGACIGFVTTSIILTLAVRAALSYWQRRVEELRAEVESLVENVISDVLTQPGSPADSSDLERQVVSRVREQTDAKYEQRRYWQNARDLTSEEEIRRRLQLRAADDEKTRSSAEKVILQLLPPLPRTAKRLLNRLYFLLVVAYNRDLIAHDRVSAEQLGKWAVLLDRWPEAGKAIIKNPSLAQALEDVAGQEGKFARLCSGYTPQLASDLVPLRGFFQTDHKLASAACRLVYLDADVKAPAPSSIPAIEPPAVPPARDAVSAPAGAGAPDGQLSTKASITRKARAGLA
jgi:hypothetical protein